jgi:hypothetical protein
VAERCRGVDRGEDGQGCDIFGSIADSDTETDLSVERIDETRVHRSGVPEKSISRMLHSKTIPKFETINEYLAPFGLKVKIALEDVA